MRITTAVLLVLAFGGVSLGDVTYDPVTQTLTYGAPADLDSAVDPATPPPLTDAQQSFGVQLADWNALSPQVIGFNTAPGIFSGTTTSVVAYYKAAQTVTFNHFAPTRDIDGNITAYGGYNWGCNTTNGRTAFSGTQVYHTFGLIQSDPTGPQPYTINYRFLSADVAVTETNSGMAGFGICLSGQTVLTTGPGELLFTLSNGTQQNVVLPVWGGGAALKDLFVGYQAPVGLFITRIEGIRYGGGTCFPASDDWSFVIKTYLPGDADGDGDVDFTDYQTLEPNFGTTTGATWIMGDFDGDGAVTFTDYQMLEANFGTVPAPEPATLALLAAGGLAIHRRRERGA